MELSADSLAIEVVDARPREAKVIALKVKPGTTLGEAIALAGLSAGPGGVGVFGKTRKLDEGIAAGDRIEIYRPLVMDPKDRRRAMAPKRP